MKLIWYYFLTFQVPSDDTSIPVLVDTDGGFYDAWAISMLLTCDQSSLHKYHVVGITTVNGVTTVENALQNVHRILKTIGGKSERIPVYQGMESPMVSHGDSIRRPSFFGSDGFGDAFPPEEISSYATSTHAVNAIIKFAEKYKGKLVVLGLGPLTNLAMAVKMQPLIKSMIKEVYILGGNAEGVGNVTVCSEFNFHVDPEAAQVVLENFTGCPIYLLPWETCLRSSSTYVSTDYNYNSTSPFEISNTVLQKPNSKYLIGIPNQDAWFIRQTTDALPQQD